MKRISFLLIGILVLLPYLSLIGCESSTHDASDDDNGDDDGSGSDTDGDGDDDNSGFDDDDNDNDNDDNDTNTGDKSCRFIDIVIIVDPSSSMQEELQAFRDDVFPSFADKLSQISEDLDDFRIATIDACPNKADFHTRGAGGECNFDSGERWINSTSSTMKEEFACVGDLYIDDIVDACDTQNDGDEMMLASAEASLTPPWTDNENKGFLRDDAILVLIPMTDEDEQNDQSLTAQQYFDRLVALKNGKVQNMVMLGIGGTSSGQSCNSLYGDVMVPAVMLKDVTDLFIAQERGIFWDLCSGQPLVNGLDAAIAIIKDACDEIDVE